MGVTNNAEVIAILMDLTNYPGGGPTAKRIIRKIRSRPFS